ncbi:uncharacterized protein LOC124144821 [Haliotis rufescens]|uniref:uncharacterized protein LOC124144821 n=1 Tax=Haliotis rufescens TaxID=6454 RepID=UPI00201F8B0A|nr:uncharacterized protein LOC124144821 [Haliotis rufescens]
MFVLYLSLLLVVPGCLSVNVIEHAGAYGPDVVTTVVDIIRSNCILPGDKLFLRRLAYVETKDGSMPKTYSDPNNSGGIWQVSSSMLAQTQGNQPELQPLYKILQDSLHINWMTVQWSDLRKPLYSGLAAALYLTLQTSHPGVTIPLKVEEQAIFWRDKYENGLSSPYNFTSTVNAMELGCQALNRQLDVVFIVDTSSSLSKDDFTRAKTFLRNIVNGLNVGRNTAHVAVITFASAVNVQFNLNNYFSKAEVFTAIGQLVYTGGATNTAGALNTATNDVFATSRGGRDSAVKVAFLITDGQSDDRINTEHAAENARNHGIAIYTVGVGNAVDATELQQVATPPACTHSYLTNGYDIIANLKQEIQNSICRAPLYANWTVECTIGTCPTYAFPFTGNNGLTIKATVSCGTSILYADVNNYYPSSAHNLIDEVLNGAEKMFYQAKPDANANYLYIMVKDSQGSNGCNVTLTPLVGNQVITGFEVICRDLPSHSPRTCTKTDLIQFRPLICDGVPTVSNPCTQADALSQKKYPFPGDTNRYIQCLPNGLFQVSYCPTDTIFDPDCETCYGRNVPKVDCTVVAQVSSNPCTAQNLLNNNFYFEFPGDHTKYIQCDIWGHAWVRSCQTSYVWVQVHTTCEEPGTSYNPCPQMALHGQRFYGYPGDMHKYIECVDTLNPQVLSCPNQEVWDDCVKTCLGMSELTPNCGSGTQMPTYTRAPTAAPQYTTIRNGASESMYEYPCTQQHIQANELYFPVPSNHHQYFQCSLVGVRYTKTCPGSDCYDPNSHTCVDGCIFIDSNLHPAGKK